MLTPLILFLGLTVATAVIAHWSDNLGKKLGKKRVSLLGLRPRTTATILTVASSWAIMLFTLVVLLVAVAPLRRALFSYDQEREQARRDRAQASAQLGETHKRLKDTQSQYNSANAKLIQANSDAANSQRAASSAEKAASAAVAAGSRAVEAARQRTAQAQTRVVEAQRKFQDAQKRESAAQQREAAAKGETRVAESDTRKAEAETRRAQDLREKAASELKTSSADLKLVEQQRVAVQKNLKALKIDYRKTSASLFNASRSAFAASRAELEASRKLNSIRSEVAVLEQQRDALQSLASATLSNDAPVKVHQVFAARVIAANQPSGVVAAQLRAMLKQGQQNFAEGEDISPLFPAGTTLELLPLTDQIGPKTTVLEGDQLMQRLARDIADSRQTISIRLIAPRNYLASETRIEAIFVAVPIAPAFKAGEILASATIDGAQGDARIFRSLLDLTDLGRREAEKRRVNPPQSPDEPNFYAEGTNVNLFESLRRLESSGARLRVNLVAARALSTVEPLQVRFEIEGSGLSAPTS